MGQGEAAEQPTEEAASEAVATTGDANDAEGQERRGPDKADGNGVVVVDFGDLGPQAA
jgi:hypothetical protein